MNLPLASSGGCGCHGHDTLPELDARTIPHAVRHGAIIGAYHSLAIGQAMVLVAPHDPKPLLAQMSDLYGEGFQVDYLERGPEAWKLQFTRR